MGFCPKCNADYGDEVPKFCSACGAKIGGEFAQGMGDNKNEGENFASSARHAVQPETQAPVAKHIASSDAQDSTVEYTAEFKGAVPAAEAGAEWGKHAPVTSQAFIATPVTEGALQTSSEKPANKNTKLPLALAIIGLCLFWIPLLGLALGVVAIVLWKKNGDDKKAPLAIGVVAVVLGLIMTISVFTNGASNASSSSQSNSTKASTEQVVETSTDGQQQEKVKSSIESIEASYDGPTDEGTVISLGNKDITVTVTREDGTTETLSSDEWIIDKSVTLVAGETSVVTISCEGKSCDLEIECTTLTPDEYKASCESPSYDDLLRYPDDWEGRSIVITGRVQQVVQGETGQGEYLVQTIDNGYGYYDGTVIVDYVASDEGINIIEDDIVTFYGAGIGTYDYTTVLGANKTVPWVMALYADLN